MRCLVECGKGEAHQNRPVVIWIVTGQKRLYLIAGIGQCAAPGSGPLSAESLLRLQVRFSPKLMFGAIKQL